MRHTIVSSYATIVPPMTPLPMPCHPQRQIRRRRKTLTASKIFYNFRVGGFICGDISCTPRCASLPRTGIPTRAKIHRIAPSLLPVPGCLPAPCRDLKKPSDRPNPRQPDRKRMGCEKAVISDHIAGKDKRSPLGTCLLTGAVVAVMEEGDVPTHIT